MGVWFFVVCFKFCKVIITAFFAVVNVITDKIVVLAYCTKKAACFRRN